MPKQVSIATDEDVYTVLKEMQEKSGTSMSQNANRLMRAGLNYTSIHARLKKIEESQKTQFNFFVRFLEQSGHEALVSEFSHMLDED
jgi:hypothetical protein